MSCWDDNIVILKERYPELAQRVLENPLTVNLKTVKAQDGLCAYGFLKEGNVLQPVTNPVNPGEKINRKLDEWRKEIQNFTRPILVIGFNPGIEVQMLFEYRENQSGNYCKQPLWICIDSIFTFYGFLRTYDAGKLLTSSRVELFWHEEMPKRVEWLRRHPEFSYLFTLFSLSSHEIQERILNPLVKLAQERQKAVDQYTGENEAYYENLSDEELARIVRGQGGRPPRLLVPSCSWSTVIQYSIRDTCEALNQRGWETRILNSPAMLTPHYVIESVHDFKPDVFLYVDHLRTEVAEVIPKNLMLMTWVQDTLPYINSVETASKWNKQVAGRNRDIIFGYVKQLEPYGYEQKRLYPLNMVVNTAIFRPKELTDAEREKYGCDVCFASNRGLPTQRVLEENLVDLFEPYGITKEQLQQWHDRLWEHYRSGESLVSYQQLINFLELDGSPDDNWVQLLFWRLNDIIYRHVVIEWLDEYAQEHPDFKINLYGQGWSEHPQFAKYACGEIQHGEELSTAYQAAKYCLHLNTLEGMHQRVTEIVATGGHIITRMQHKKDRQPEPLTHAFRKLFLTAGKGESDPLLADDEIRALNEDFFGRLQTLVNENPDSSLKELQIKAVELFDSRLKGTLLAMLDEWKSHVFGNKEELFALLGARNIPSLSQTSLEKTRKRLQTHTDDMLKILQDTFPLEESEVKPDEVKEPYPDCFALLECLYAIQTDDVAYVKSAYKSLVYPSNMINHLVVSCLAGKGRYIDVAAVLKTSCLMDATDKQLLGYALYCLLGGDSCLAQEYVKKAYIQNHELKDGYADLGLMAYKKQILQQSEARAWLKKDEQLGRLSSSGRLQGMLLFPDQYSTAEGMLEIDRLYKQDNTLRDGHILFAWHKYITGWKNNFAKVLPFAQHDYTLNRLTWSGTLNYIQALTACGHIEIAESIIEEAYSANGSFCDGHASCAFFRWFLLGYDPERVLAVFKWEEKQNRLSKRYQQHKSVILAASGRWEEACNNLQSVHERLVGCFKSAWIYYVHHRNSNPDFNWRYYYDIDSQNGGLNSQKSLLYPALQLLSEETPRCDYIDDIYRKSREEEAVCGYTLLACYDFLINRDPVRACSLVEKDIKCSRLPGFYQLIYIGFYYAAFGTFVQPDSWLNKNYNPFMWTFAKNWLRRIGCHQKMVEDLFAPELEEQIKNMANL